jgi:hypothetical protein
LSLSVFIRIDLWRILMKLDFWNNPIVVSAFRVKYRRGGLSSTILLYFLVLAMLGAIMQYYNVALQGDWQRKYYIALMGIQFGVSSFMACITTSASVRAEVVNRTLDFQRIATLSPRQILLGKLLGEPALAYLLAIATIPLAAWCMLLGGVSPEVFMLMYVNLATTILLAGSFGLVNRLELPQGKPAGAQPGGEGAAFGILASVILPAPVFAGLISQDLWRFAMPFFGQEIPFIFVVPVVQLGLAVLPFLIMVRLLVHPLNPLLGKRAAYVTLFVVDVLAAAALVESPLARWNTMGWTFGSRSAAFGLTHLLASGMLMTLLTPRGEIVETWIWRFRGRAPWWRDWWVGERSPNVAALFTFCAMGVVNWLLLLWLPALLIEGEASVTPGVDVAASVLAGIVILTLSIGVLYQLIMFIPGKRRTILSNLISLVIFVPYLVGKLEEYYPVGLLLDLSPIDHFRHWLKPGMEPRNLLPLLLLYGWVLLGAGVAVYLRLRRMQTAVDQKLLAMGVARPTR